MHKQYTFHFTVFTTIVLLLVWNVVHGQEHVSYSSSSPIVPLHYRAFRSIRAAEQCYGIIIDAGSSGSRANIYNWPCRKTATTPELSISQIQPTIKINPGISSLSKPYTSTVPAYLNTLVDFAKTKVPSNQTAFTPIIFRATAGMRLMNELDQAEMLKVVADVLGSSGFYFENPNYAQVMSGAFEGLFSWVTANYVLGLLKKSVPASDTSAVVDIGGASFQLTFNPATVPSDPNFQGNLALTGINSYKLYTYSFLGYGNDQARYTILSNSNVTENVVYSPCFNVGFNSTNVTPNNVNLRVIGTGNADECRKSIRQFLNVTSGCTDCTINGLFRSAIPTSMSIYGISSIGFFMSSANSANPNYNATVTLSDYLQLANSICSLNFSNLPNDDNKANLCFQGLYSYEVFTTAFGLPPTRVITATNTIQNFDLNWAFGSLMYEVGLLPCKAGTENCPVSKAPVGQVTGWLGWIAALILVIGLF